MSDDPASRFRENVTEITATVVTGVWLAAMFTGQSWWLAALLFGYIVVVPLVSVLFGDEEDREEWWDDASWFGWWDELWEESDSGEERSQSETHAEGSFPDGEQNNRDALETLRNRYARGELTDAQFERKLEALLETETIENAEEWTRERRRGEPARERFDRERDRDGDLEYES